MRELALFAGAGGGILGGHLLGWHCVCACELDGYARRVLLARQRDGMLPHFPIWDDVATFDGRPWRGRVDVVSGGFPCQDISCAGTRRGLDGERSGLWAEFARIVGEVRPLFVFVENSPELAVRGLGTVLGDLATVRYDARWGVYSAEDAGAWHLRERLWIAAWDPDRVVEEAEFGLPVGDRALSGRVGSAADVARQPSRVLSKRIAAELARLERDRVAASDVDGVGEQQPSRAFQEEWGWADDGVEALAYADGYGRGTMRTPVAVSAAHGAVERGGSATSHTRGRRYGASQGQVRPGRVAAVNGGWWGAEPDVVRMVHGLPYRVDRIKCLGNAQLPAVAALAWRELTRGLRIVN